jgi:hypothetical protein
VVLSEDLVHERPRNQLRQLRGEEIDHLLGQMLAQENARSFSITQHVLEERIMDVVGFDIARAFKQEPREAVRGYFGAK